ncbi:MAG: alpha/beta hydrolase [Pseudomonadota bacterium]
MQLCLRMPLICIGILVTSSLAASAEPVASHKDRLFSYPDVLEARDGGDFLKVDYREGRDIDRRDQVPEKRVRSAYIDNRARRATRTATVETPRGAVTFGYAGDITDARFIVVYVHGRGGNHRQGINDFSFGGNFNRIKALMLKSGGAYVAPDAGELREADYAKLSALFLQMLERSARARLVIACGSAGAAVCYQVADDKTLMHRLGGIILLGAYTNPAYALSLAGRARVPVVIGHGSRDTVFDIAKTEAFYTGLRKTGVPVQMVRFETGTHGTPIRMIDWRKSLNWILTR